MSTSKAHLFRQGPTVLSLAGTFARSVVNRGSREAGTAQPVTGQQFDAVVAPRHPDLVRDYIKHVGGDPNLYRGVLPPYMFPQWGMPMLAKTLAHLRYDMRNILNGGFSFEVRAPIPADRPLHLTSRLEEVDDDGRRAILTQLLVTGTEECREALLTRVTAILPLKAAGKGERKEKPLVPQDACEIAMLRFPRGAGLDFGILSGDLNPVHWIRAYARMAGFKSTIMHGFSVAARAIESLNREVFSGRTARIKNFECRFVRPLPYPSSAGVFVDWKGLVFVGDAPGGPAYLTGSYSKTTEGR